MVDQRVVRRWASAVVPSPHRWSLCTSDPLLVGWVMSTLVSMRMALLYSVRRELASLMMRVDVLIVLSGLRK